LRVSSSFSSKWLNGFWWIFRNLKHADLCAYLLYQLSQTFHSHVLKGTALQTLTGAEPM
jgi:hypothetical protein